MSFMRAIVRAAAAPASTAPVASATLRMRASASASAAPPLLRATATRAYASQAAVTKQAHVSATALLGVRRSVAGAPFLPIAAAAARRPFSTAAAAAPVAASSSSSSSSPASPSSSSSSPGDVEIKIMAHYLGSDAFASVSVPAHLSARAWRFAQPNSVLIPLDGLLAPPSLTQQQPSAVQGAASTTVAAAAAAGTPGTPLSSLFSLPALAVAPIVRIPSESSTPTSVAAALPASSSLAFEPTAPFVVAFQYGAIVFFNASESMQQELLAKLAGSKDLAKLKDDYKIVLSAPRVPHESFSCRFLTDSVAVSGMDLNSVRIISQILSQAVAMQHYEGEANRLLIKLRAMSRPAERMQGVSTLGHTKSDLIVNYVAESSIAMVDVLTELKLLDRSEIVWGHGEYDPLWTGLRREFDLSDRFDILQTKLDLLRDSHPFFLQVIHQLQSHRMEIIIIALIAIEVVLGLLEVHHRYF